MALYVGLMSGTSMDSVDVAVVDLTDDSFELLSSHRHAIPDDLLPDLRSALDPAASARFVFELDRAIAKLFAEAALTALEKSRIPTTSVEAIGSHGQTVFHQPDGSKTCTAQLGDPSTIAYLTGITTVANFRQMDVAAGGQGAPLSPAFHAWLFGNSERDQLVVNIGGIANLSILPGAGRGEVTGFDTGPGNTLMDLWIERHRGQAFDRDGRWASSGRTLPALLSHLLEDPYFARAAPKSTGREYFNLPWLQARIANTAGNADFDATDIQATLSALTATSIAQACLRHSPSAASLFLCGGGAHNQHLTDLLAHRLPDVSVQTTAALGLHPDWVEAAAFAWLARQRLNGIPVNCPSVTGAERETLLGGVFRRE